MYQALVPKLSAALTNALSATSIPDVLGRSTVAQDLGFKSSNPASTASPPSPLGLLRAAVSTVGVQGLRFPHASPAPLPNFSSASSAQFETDVSNVAQGLGFKASTSPSPTSGLLQTTISNVGIQRASLHLADAPVQLLLCRACPVPG